MSVDPPPYLDTVEPWLEDLLARATSISRTDRDAVAALVRTASDAQRRMEEARRAESKARAAIARILEPPTATDTTRAARSAPAVELAEALLVELLPRDGRAHPSKPIVEVMNARGVSTASVHRARVRLGITTSRTKAFHAETRWSWPPLISGNAR